MERRLAAIIAADIVGYSRLMGEDEPGALSAIGTLRSDVIDPAIAARGGRLVKAMADGFLLEFAGAVEAVECALEIQDRVAHMTGETEAAQSIESRVGVNVGDVMVDARY
jgi:adenylate cyclase